MNSYDQALERVHNLYLLQTKLIDSLDGNLGDPDVRKEVRENIKQFEQLLRKADWRFMGGEDVLETLRQIPGTVNQRIRENTSIRRKKSVAQRERARRQKKAVKAKAKKPRSTGSGQARKKMTKKSRRK
jgi:hypothetical protein